MPPITDWVDLTVLPWDADLTVRENDGISLPAYIPTEDSLGYLLTEDGFLLIGEAGDEGEGFIIPGWLPDLTTKEDL